MKSRVYFSIAPLVVLMCNIAIAGDTARPVGRNCQLQGPTKDAGETFGHGAFLQVYPRNSAIDATYSGCQAVFVTTAKEATRLAWLIEIWHGDPVRMWSSDPELAPYSGCRYRRGMLVSGDSGVCSSNATGVILLPSQPAGCEEEPRGGAQCEYDDG